MKIKWLGHSCFLITARDGARIITDPYQVGTETTARYYTYSRIDEEAEIVTISHDHTDHCYVGDIKGNPEVFKGPGIHHARGIHFKGVAAFHDAVQGKERGPNTIFCFMVEGMRLCHLGDLGHPLSQAQIGEIGKVDILFVPSGGPPATLELAEVVKLCDAISPGVIIPMHYKNDRCDFPKYAVNDFIRGRKNVRRLKSGEVEIDRLPDSPEIVVLQHAR